MENIFYQFLNPAGSSYAPKMKIYRAIKEMEKTDIIRYLEENYTHRQLMELLSDYLLAEVNYDKDATPKVRLTQEQFEAFFRVIKPHAKKDDDTNLYEMEA